VAGLSAPRALLLFLDGVGVGAADPLVNPLAVARLPALASLSGGALLNSTGGPPPSMLPLDATLGVDGLPQSGTGQTALFTGTNAAESVGKHFGPWAHSALHPVIEHQSLFRQLARCGKSTCFANAFPQRFFDYALRRRSRLTVTTLSCMGAGTRLRDAADLATGRAISADITSEGWQRLGYGSLPIVEPAQAGRTLARLTGEYGFVLFEYWWPDRAGHARDMRQAVEVLEKFDAFLLGILEGIDRAETLLLITSDHGNIEDLSTKSHTRHPVPLIAAGAGADSFFAHVRGSSSGVPNLTAVAPALLEVLGCRR
jgi:2,3-bisphosphoglycerate-independent phosphoglycerate mutase